MASWDISLTSSRSTTVPAKTVIVKSAPARLSELFREVGRHSTARDVSDDWCKVMDIFVKWILGFLGSGIRSVSLSNEIFPRHVEI